MRVLKYARFSGTHLRIKWDRIYWFANRLWYLYKKHLEALHFLIHVWVLRSIRCNKFNMRIEKIAFSYLRLCYNCRCYTISNKKWQNAYEIWQWQENYRLLLVVFRTLVSLRYYMILDPSWWSQKIYIASSQLSRVVSRLRNVLLPMEG
jgi:hypothetical protein